eukprot:2795267-Rhodomonas_salina.3
MSRWVRVSFKFKLKPGPQGPACQWTSASHGGWPRADENPAEPDEPREPESASGVGAAAWSLPVPVSRASSCETVRFNGV